MSTSDLPEPTVYLMEAEAFNGFVAGQGLRHYMATIGSPIYAIYISSALLPLYMVPGKWLATLNKTFMQWSCCTASPAGLPGS